MPLVKGNGSVNYDQVLECRKQFIIDHFNKADITQDAKSLVDIYAAIASNDDGLDHRKRYLDFLLRVMG
ncbi:hypothetical protein HUN01_30530 [Nostoc edaphicum CCNP1411]|uniref:Uncharacterized protein n=1 Tax=Nostoc edaphicum CCNP1411 TaxID=1472755 RepID=A0A7D7QIZ4_9NOSO|nr:hypothetical protein [Nostoc edaphicum]QMS91722.1 hypothetical protein HUN01_30530 [Nostoc edaphicum CCNP1411]